jgi:hypothetical protein
MFKDSESCQFASELASKFLFNDSLESRIKLSQRRICFGGSNKWTDLS